MDNEAEGSIDRDVGELANQFGTYSGFMRTPDGFEVLHAIWPAYPAGHGVKIALQVLAAFPPDTPLYQVDNIDRCSLFVVGRKPGQDVYSSQYLHIALWDEDLLQCADKGFVEGVGEHDGNLELNKEFVVLTGNGAHAALIDDLTSGLDTDFSLVLEHLYGGHYDTAVREASVMVENELKKASALTDFGQRLIESCFGDGGALVPSGLSNAERCQIRTQFRCYFTYVRNEYAHNIQRPDLTKACRLVRRSNDLFAVIRRLKTLKIAEQSQKNATS